MDRIEKFAELIDTMREVSRVMNTAEKKQRVYGTNVGLHPSEIHTLDKISKNEGITVSKLAELVDKTRSSITQITNKLEKKGMIHKLRNKDYYKEINIYLTELGAETSRFHKEFDKKVYSYALERFDNYDVEDFQRFKDMLDIIGEITKNYDKLFELEGKDA